MRFQFGLRTLMIAALLIGLVSYWIAPVVLEFIQPEPDAAPFRTHGGII